MPEPQKIDDCYVCGMFCCLVIAIGLTICCFRVCGCSEHHDTAKYSSTVVEEAKQPYAK